MALSLLNQALEGDLKPTQQLLAARKNQVTSMLRSRSWRLTAPLRKIAILTRRIRNSAKTSSRA